MRQQAPESVLRNRHTRIARGMTKTLYRHNDFTRLLARPTGRPIMNLSVRGTLDVLRGYRLFVERVACECCGSTGKGKLRLNKTGRAKLEALREKYGKS